MGDQKPCTAVAGEAGSPLKQSHYETHADPLAQWASTVSLQTWRCVSFVPSGIGMGLRAAHSKLKAPTTSNLPQLNHLTGTAAVCRYAVQPEKDYVFKNAQILFFHFSLK